MATHQMTVNILNDLTSLISGTEIVWNYEAIEVWIDGASTAFTQTDEILDIPTYTSGNIRVESKLYILSQALSEYLPKDPTNPASDLVFWDSRAMKYPLIATSMKSIESGIVESRISTFTFMYRGDWEDLALLSPSFVNKSVKVYRDGALLYSGFSTGSGAKKGVFTVSLGTVEPAIEGQCTFGDPDHLVRIDTSSNTAFYNGANIQDKWDGKAIPMVFGPRTPYEDFEGGNIERGQVISVVAPLVLPKVFEPSRIIGPGTILKVMPTSATQGILCRTPGYATLGSFPANETIFIGNVRLFSKTTFSTASTTLIEGQLVRFYQGDADEVNQSGRVLTNTSSGASFSLAIEDFSTGAVGNQNYASFDYNEQAHLCTKGEINKDFTGYTLSSQATSGGNKLWKINITGSLDLTDSDYYFVCTNVTGSRSAPQVAKYILESHGMTVDSTFDTLGGIYTENASMQIGNDDDIQTVNEALAEINESLLTLIKKPLGGDTYSMQAIDTNPTTTITVTDFEIGSVNVNEKSNSTYGAVQYEPLYLRASKIRDQVYKYQTSVTNNIYDTKRVKTINHVLDQSLVSRFNEITEYWARPRKDVGFILLDETVAIEIGDYVQVNHEDFTGKIMVTSLSPKQLGTAIQGIEL